MQSFYFQGFVLLVEASPDIGHLDWHDKAARITTFLLTRKPYFLIISDFYNNGYKNARDL
jgi:hypothetical protein